MQTTNVLINSTTAPQLVDLTLAEDEWLATLLATAEAKGYLGEIGELFEAFDNDRDDWAAQPPHRRPEPGQLINLYAVAFGQQLATEHDLDWVGLQKGSGVEVALRGGARPLTLLPFPMVAKRWHDPACRSLADLHSQTVAGLRG